MDARACQLCVCVRMRTNVCVCVYARAFVLACVQAMCTYVEDTLKQIRRQANRQAERQRERQIRVSLSERIKLSVRIFPILEATESEETLHRLVWSSSS